MKRSTNTTIARPAGAKANSPPPVRQLIPRSPRLPPPGGKPRWIRSLLLACLLVLLVGILTLAFFTTQQHYQDLATKSAEQLNHIKLQHKHRLTQLSTELSDLRQQHVEQLTGLASEHHDSLLLFGDSLGSTYDKRQSRYEQGREVALTYHLPTTDADERLRQLADEIKRNAPASLPRGCRLQVAAANMHPHFPLLFVEVSVLQPSGEFLSTLLKKDFSLCAGDTPLPLLAATQGSRIDGSLSLAILLDTSNSTTGAALEQAKAGALRLVTSLPDTAAARLYSFGEQILACTDWTADQPRLKSAISELRSNGQTPLLRVLELATRDLAKRQPPRAILLFTDGHDTEGGPTPNALLASCKEHAITVYAVSLRTQELDPALLDHLATHTNGAHLSSERASELATTFGQLSASLRRPVYRLAAHLPEGCSSSISLTVGDANAVSTTFAIPGPVTQLVSAASDD